MKNYITYELSNNIGVVINCNIDKVIIGKNRVKNVIAMTLREYENKYCSVVGGTAYPNEIAIGALFN